jgi:hypothetical protein
VDIAIDASLHNDLVKLFLPQGDTKQAFVSQHDHVYISVSNSDNSETELKVLGTNSINNNIEIK